MRRIDRSDIKKQLFNSRRNCRLSLACDECERLIWLQVFGAHEKGRCDNDRPAPSRMAMDQNRARRIYKGFQSRYRFQKAFQLLRWRILQMNHFTTYDQSFRRRKLAIKTENGTKAGAPNCFGIASVDVISDRNLVCDPIHL